VKTIRKKQSSGQPEGFAVTGKIGRVKDGEKDENRNRTSSCNNRSLALRRTFGRFESEWELSSRIVPIRVLQTFFYLC